MVFRFHRKYSIASPTTGHHQNLYGRFDNRNRIWVTFLDKGIHEACTVGHAIIDKFRISTDAHEFWHERFYVVKRQQ